MESDVLPAVFAEPDFSFDEMSYTPSATTFRLFAPSSAQKVVVRLYREGQGGRPQKTIRMKLVDDHLWQVVVEGDLKGLFYTFDIGRGETPGVFAKAVGVNGRRGFIVGTAVMDSHWDEQRPVIASPADWIVYELHHRDFSIARHGCRYPGKYLALTEPWAIEYLQELGINAVQLMPSFDFASVDETRLDLPQYNWGYDPLNYNVPEGSYATDPYDPVCRIREFKQMVQALHRAGIAVILDVVYNHTFDVEHSNFQLTFPDYYYRRSNTLLSNGSGCGNETASERLMMRRFMTESVKYWATEYHIDGFRFDLMGCHDVETMNQIRRVLNDVSPSILIYGEAWSAGPCALPTKLLARKARLPKMPGIAAFCDELRDALRGPFSDDGKGGFLLGVEGMEESVKAGIVGMIRHRQVNYKAVNYAKRPYAKEPTQMVAYVSCHDDLCLTDRLNASLPECICRQSRLMRLDLLAQTVVMVSQGIPFLLSGEELLRSKQGVRNSYQSPDSINQIDWQNRERYPQVFEYYKRLIALRRHHPAFRLGKAVLVMKHLEFLPTTTANVIAFQLKNHAGNDEWRNIIVVINGSEKVIEQSVPQADYTVICSNGRIDEAGIATTGLIGQVVVAPQMALILHD